MGKWEVVMSKKRKKDMDILVKFIGNDSIGVTGSMEIVEYFDIETQTRKQLLLECGAIQGGGTSKQDIIANMKMLERLKVDNLEYVFVIHSHCDHTGLLPVLINKGYSNYVISTYENYEILKELLPDATHIHMSDIDQLRSKGEKIKYLYNEQDCYEILDRFDIREIGEIIKLNETISFRYSTNSHCEGANQLELFIKKPNNQVKKILKTSDLGNILTQPMKHFIRPTEIITKSNLMICESTYGDRVSFTKKDVLEERKRMIELIDKYVLHNNARAFVPCFSYSRLQQIMCFIYDNYKDTWDYEKPIIVDTRLGCKMNHVYQKILKGEELEYWNKVMSWKAFKFIDSYKGTAAFLSKYTSSLILSSSGMISAGHSVLYAQSIVSSSKDIIMFCGYCNPNTLGYKIMNPEQKTITIQKQQLLKRCHVEKFNTWSSHAQQEDLIKYFKQHQTDRIVLVHGDESAKEILKEKSEEELRSIGKTTPIVCAYKGLEIKL